jgi:hypothetical protein
MAWPTAAELKQRLDITSDDWDDHMDRLIAHGIAWAKAKVGDWDEDFDVPTDALAQSALERAVEQATTGESVAGTSLPRKSESLLYGHRRRFGIG